MTELTAGVDLGGTKIQTVVLRGDDVVGSVRVPTPHTGADDVVASIAATIHEALGHADATLTDLLGVGIGSPGAIDTARGVVSESPNVPGFQEKVAARAEGVGGLRRHLAWRSTTTCAWRCSASTIEAPAGPSRT